MARAAAIARTAALLGAVLALGLPGCADLDRRIFESNRRFARKILQPMARHYRATVPEPLRKGLRNVTNNVTYPDVMVNNFLQGKPDRAISDLGRIVVNTVVGFGGIFDPATDIGIPRYDEDFGQTLGVWGFGQGPYFQAPFVGPTTLRDVWQYPFGIVTSPFTYVDATVVSLPLGVANYFFERFDDVERLDIVDEAVDPYAFVKDAYLQRRLDQVYDGNPPTKVDEGFDEQLDEALEDLEGLDDLEDLEDLEGLEGLEDLDDAEAPGGLDALDDLDDSGEMGGLRESEALGVVEDLRGGALPPPRIVRRSLGPPPAVPRPRALPRPVVRQHTARRDGARR